MKTYFLILFFFLNVNLLAQIEVTQVRGRAYFKKQPLKKGMILKEKGKVITSKGSLCRLSLNKGSSQVIVGPSSVYLIEKLPTQKGPSTSTLLKGSLRYFGHQKDKDKDKERPQIKTKHISLGIRGTDFLLMTNPDLEESEIVMFEGRVRLGNIAQPRNRIDVKAGEWGGLGGRFGDRFQNPITLPKKTLKTFEAQLKK